MNFADRLFDAIDRKGCPAVVGIDPRPDLLPRPLREQAERGISQAAEAIREFSLRVVDVVAPLVPAVKPNLAFFEALGWEGYRAFGDVVTHARASGLLVIADAKRGDIGSTAEAYARGLFDVLDVDAVTLSPWLGTDSLLPFFERADRGKGFFILVRTSNPSAAEIQELLTDGGPVYERVADLVREWGLPRRGRRGWSSVGAVVGATAPDVAASLRRRMEGVPFLLPGYGAQGGKAEALRQAFDDDGRGAIVNSSRGILYAFGREPFASELGEDRWEEAVRQATLAMREDLERIL